MGHDAPGRIAARLGLGQTFSTFGTDQSAGVRGMLIDIIDVQPLEHYRVLLTFEGGESRIVDIGQLVDFSGVFEPLLDEAFFRRVRVEPDLGTIVWPNGADLCPEVLFEAGIPASASVAHPL